MEVGDYMPKFNDDIIGKKVMQHCGMNATCIAYRGNKDIDIKFEDGTVVTPALLKERGIVKKQLSGIKVLGEGQLEKKLTVQAHKFSKNAIDKINESGSKAEVI